MNKCCQKIKEKLSAYNKNYEPKLTLQDVYNPEADIFKEQELDDHLIPYPVRHKFIHLYLRKEQARKELEIVSAELERFCNNLMGQVHGLQQRAMQADRGESVVILREMVRLWRNHVALVGSAASHGLIFPSLMDFPMAAEHLSDVADDFEDFVAQEGTTDVSEDDDTDDDSQTDEDDEYSWSDDDNDEL